MVLLFVVCGWREEAVVGVYRRMYSVHSTYVFLYLFWVKPTVHVGDFIQSLLRLYLCLLFISYIYLRIPTYLGLRGEPLIFSDLDFFAVPSNAFIRIHMSLILFYGSFLKSLTQWPAHTAMIASAIGPGLKSQPGIQFFFANFGTNSYKRIHTIAIQIV